MGRSFVTVVLYQNFLAIKMEYEYAIALRNHTNVEVCPSEQSHQIFITIEDIIKNFSNPVLTIFAMLMSFVLLIASLAVTWWLAWVIALSRQRELFGLPSLEQQNKSQVTAKGEVVQNESTRQS
eukprot:TRINITY_DN8677_c0_g1_i5.p2 TRINITY_DN8677_c0_g1~~TRINITY_DN8677_c0_g1_i5.p2  ORF type:complete len:124 (-),score=11.17 TRINITY_DN8677_c0_g1_i5:369-740(-)